MTEDFGVYQFAFRFKLPGKEYSDHIHKSPADENLHETNTI